jgi:regulator of Ty1 transposition protein 103
VQAAQDGIERAANIKKRIGLAPEAMGVLEQNLPPVQPSFIQPSVSFAPLPTTDEDKKAAAAAVAAKLAASTSSALMLKDVLSSLVAEEAASMNNSLNSTGFASGLPAFNPEKRPRIENQMPVSDVNNSDMGNSSFFTTLQQPSMANVPLTPSSALQPNQLQVAYVSPPQPPHSPVNPPANQYVTSMIGGIPYGFGPNSLPPPPPLPPHVVMGLSRSSVQPSQSQQPQAQQAQQQQQPSTGGYYRPPGIGFYGQSHPSTPPAPLPRQ